VIALQPDKERENSNAVAIFNEANWPTEQTLEFGEQEVKFMCHKFGLSFSNLKKSFIFVTKKTAVANSKQLRSI